MSGSELDSQIGTDEDISLDDLSSPRAFCEKYPDIASEGGLRWEIFNAAQNGLNDYGAITRRGRRVFIIEPRYLKWLLSRSSLRGAHK